MRINRSWLWILAPLALSAGVLWLSAQEGKPPAAQGGINVADLAEKLQAREKACAQKEGQLRELEQRLGTLQATLDKDRQDLIEKEKSFQEAKAKFETERTRVSIDPRMVQTYQAMEPASAAQALKELNQSNPDMAVSLLGALPAKKAARVLEQLGQLDAKLMARLLEKVGSTKAKATS